MSDLAITDASDAERAASAFMGEIFYQILGQSDEYITEGLDPKTSAYILDRAAENPDIRGTLAKATKMRQAKPHRGQRRSPEFVYFIQQGRSGPIKIGSAVDPKARLATLQTGNPVTLRLVGMTDGGEVRERLLHREFSHLRLSGEWFEPAAELMNCISEVSA